MKVLRRTLLTILAIAFLIETWIWDSFAALGHWIADRIPFAAFKAAVERLVARLPASVALCLFVIPAFVIFPFKIGGLWLIAHGQIIAGGLVFIAAKFAGVGAAAFLFELTRDKLMTMEWFAKLYRLVMGWRAWAHRLVDPYMAEIRARMRAVKDQVLRATMGERGQLARTILRMRERMRKRRMQGKP